MDKERKQDLIFFLIVDILMVSLGLLTGEWVIPVVIILTASIVVPIHRTFDLKVFRWS